jgi:hypothetical protein
VRIAVLFPVGALLICSAIGAGAQTTPKPAPSPSTPLFAPNLPCPTMRPRFATIAIDPAAPVSVNATQQFVVALRAVEDAGFSWRVVNAPKPNTITQAEGMQSVWDVAFQNLARSSGTAPQVGGSATEMFLFTAGAPGTAALDFGLFAPGAAAPTRTVTFTVNVSPNVVIC